MRPTPKSFVSTFIFTASHGLRRDLTENLTWTTLSSRDSQLVNAEVIDDFHSEQKATIVASHVLGKSLANILQLNFILKKYCK